MYVENIIIPIVVNKKTLFVSNSINRFFFSSFVNNTIAVMTENKPIDYAFIDGHHDEKATISYFEKFIPHLSKNSIIVFDDISWSDGMRHAWENIEKNKVVKISLDLGVIGICVLDENIDEKYSFRIPMF